MNVTGHSLAHWPWTRAQKERFLDSRVGPTRALCEAISHSRIRPKVFVQSSGINFYGLRGPTVADETTLPAADFLAELTVVWEKASERLEELGVRRVVTRNAVVLDSTYGLLPTMALPVRLFIGSRLGDGTQAMCWIHIADYLGVLRLLLESPDPAGAYNLIAPTPTSSDQFVRALGHILRRPIWMRLPPFLLRLVLGEMHVLVTGGRYCRPRRIEQLGYKFEFPDIESALDDLYGAGQHSRAATPRP